LFVFGKKNKNDEIASRALIFLEKNKSEKNTLLQNWNKIGIQSSNSLTSQALIQLKNYYCDNKKCLQCMIGNQLIR